MARPREFDHDDVLDRAVDVFWRRGFEGTSVRDLEAATRLNRGSLYGAFGDKERLFLAVLDRYAERFSGTLFGQIATSASPRAALIAVFEAMPRDLLGSPHPRGCLVASTCAELPVGSDGIARKAAWCLSHLEDMFYAALRRMQVLGEIDVESDPRALARFLTGTVQGMAVMARATDDVGVLRDVATTALTAVFRTATPKAPVPRG